MAIHSQHILENRCASDSSVNLKSNKGCSHIQNLNLKVDGQFSNGIQSKIHAMRVRVLDRMLGNFK